ncbi:MAG: hypothetical protein GX102_13870 [Porphyromonadaceae bacterium]|nr:hypothetical protein [Porphyromonadaceae bacterium]
MKKLLLSSALILLISFFGFGLTEKDKNSRSNTVKSDKYPFNLNLKDSLELQEYIDYLIDSLKLDKPTNPKLKSDRKYYFNQPSDSSNIKRFFRPHSGKHPNPNFKLSDSERTKPYVTHSQLDNMPINVPEDIYLPTKKVEDKSNMPIKVPEGAEKTEKAGKEKPSK